MSKAEYLLSDAKRAARYRRFADVPEPQRLESELAAARLMCEQAIESNNPTLAVALLATISKLSVAHVNSQIRAGALLERATVLNLGVNIVNLIAEEMQTLCGYEDVLARIAERVPALILEPARITQSHEETQ